MTTISNKNSHSFSCSFLRKFKRLHSYGFDMSILFFIPSTNHVFLVFKWFDDLCEALCILRVNFGTEFECGSLCKILEGCQCNIWCVKREFIIVYITIANKQTQEWRRLRESLLKNWIFVIGKLNELWQERLWQ